ncbi:mechanosensitive ion channel family protein [Vulgatibacter sp.]|uniref:mechanosensitive ion channel family protein n=1 Tax=Vulgatibacter sp. TaxID=1971226 RepID=UPI0035656642
MSDRSTSWRLAPLVLVGVVLLLGAGAPAHAAGVELRAPAEGIDRSTPRRALRHFVHAARAGEGDRAARALDLRGLPPEERRDSPRLARQLQFVLDQKLWIDWNAISDDPDGDPADGANRDVVGTIALGEREVAIELIRIDGRWALAGGTVRAIPALYDAYGGAPFVDSLPQPLVRWRFFELAAWQWLGLLVALSGAALTGLLLGTLLVFTADRIARRTPVKWDDQLVGVSSGPVRLFTGLLAVGAFVGPLHLAAPAQAVVDLLWRILIVVAVAWFLVRFVGFLADTVQAALVDEGPDPAKARAVRTQVVVLRRVALAVVWVVASALVLVQFEVVRTVGVSLLASAGIAGVALGLAAQKSLTTLFAGIQLSFTQPVRIGDQVIVEGEWGTVEEIRLTYVVVKIWDLRRLVLPITYFLEKPFQNWTKSSSEILGTVEIHADFTLPVEAARAEVLRICEASGDWDGKSCGLQVTQLGDRTMTLRALVSAADAGRAWNLRCEVREKMIAWLQRHEGGRYLPRARYASADEEAGANVAVESALR